MAVVYKSLFPKISLHNRLPLGRDCWPTRRVMNTSVDIPQRDEDGLNSVDYGFLSRPEFERGVTSRALSPFLFLGFLSFI